jgi:hypothetical protein
VGCTFIPVYTQTGLFVAKQGEGFGRASFPALEQLEKLLSAKVGPRYLRDRLYVDQDTGSVFIRNNGPAGSSIIEQEIRAVLEKDDSLTPGERRLLEALVNDEKPEVLGLVEGALGIERLKWVDAAGNVHEITKPGGFMSWTPAAGNLLSARYNAAMNRTEAKWASVLCAGLDVFLVKDLVLLGGKATTWAFGKVSLKMLANRGAKAGPTLLKDPTGKPVFAMSPGSEVRRAPNWTYVFEGGEQQQAQRLVQEAGEIAGIRTGGVRTSYSPDAMFPFYDVLDDSRFALVIDRGTLAYQEHSTRQLVAIHELLHARDINRFGIERMQALRNTPRYEMEIEKEAFDLIEQHYRRLGRELPEETKKAHADYVRRLSER